MALKDHHQPSYYWGSSKDGKATEPESMTMVDYLARSANSLIDWAFLDCDFGLSNLCVTPNSHTNQKCYKMNAPVVAIVTGAVRLHLFYVSWKSDWGLQNRGIGEAIAQVLATSSETPFVLCMWDLSWLPYWINLLEHWWKIHNDNMQFMPSPTTNNLLNHPRCNFSQRYRSRFQNCAKNPSQVPKTWHCRRGKHSKPCEVDWARPGQGGCINQQCRSKPWWRLYSAERQDHAWY